MQTTRRSFLALATAAPLVPPTPRIDVPRTLLIADEVSGVTHILSSVVERQYGIRALVADWHDEAEVILARAKEPFGLVYWGMRTALRSPLAPRVLWCEATGERRDCDLPRPFTLRQFFLKLEALTGWTRTGGA